MATRNCANCTYAEVNNAVNGVAGGGGTWTGNPAADGDIINLPAGSATWTSTLNITKNIQLIGAGETSTIITENLTRVGLPSLINVSLSHDQASGYSFRLSAMEFKSAVLIGTVLASDNAFVEISGSSHATDTVTPYITGCVSRVRVDHIKFTKMNGIALIVESVLGVGDHITLLEQGTTYVAFAMKVLHTRWTPDVDPATGDPLPSSYVAEKAFGSWADDPYWGTDKFWFFEDCNFTIPDNTNIADDDQGARVVFRHCTVNGGGGMASHGMEGRDDAGIKQQEIYNCFFVTTRLFAQHRSGTILFFNNRGTGLTKGPTLRTYREARNEGNWGGVGGNCRYDNNAGVLLYSGTVTSTNGSSSITDSSKANFNSINLSNGTIYAVMDLDAPTGYGLTDPGWLYKGASVSGVSGNTLTLIVESGWTPNWAVGHNYEIRQVHAAYGQPGQGKGNLLNASPGNNSYVTYTYPATSGPKATYPHLGYPLEPCYCFNNTDDTHGYLNLLLAFGGKSLLVNRDFYNLSERTIETQQVGFPPQPYSRATSDYPNIGPGQIDSYTPFTYPHPLVTGAAPSGPIIVVPTVHDFENVIVGESASYDIPVRNDGDSLLSVLGVVYPTGYDGPTTGFTLAAGATVIKTMVFEPLSAIPYTGDVVFNSDGDVILAGNGTMAVTGTGVLPSGGGGTGKGHKKGVLVSRSRT